MYVLETLDSV